MRRLKAPQRRQQLIDVATKLFADYGYDATTTAAIAQAAGISEPILYRHFKNKQDLFIAITREVSQKTLNHWQNLIGATEDPAEQLRLIAKEFPAHVRHLSDAYHVLHNGLTTSHDRRVLTVLREHYASIEKFFVKIIVGGQRTGAFRNINPKIPAWHMINLGIGYAMIGLNLSQFDHFPVEESIEFILKGLRS